MPSEQSIKAVLDLLTTAPVSHVESLGFSARSRTNDMRTMIEQKNVVAVGISEKISNNKKTGKLALTFYVEKKLPLDKLKGSQVIPPTVPESLSGSQAIPTDVVVIGKLKPQVNPNVTRRPIQPGYSIGHFKITAGTLGAVVTDGTDFFILSNSHVLADSGKGKKGDAILYPGKFDGGLNPADRIGTLHDFLPFTKGGDFVNPADCALASIDAGKLSILKAGIKGGDVPKGTLKPKRGMRIVKVGRTTGKTTGEIRDVNFRTTIDYGAGVGVIGFTDQVLCTRYTEGGDSGSLVIEKASGKAVGLHFAGSEEGSVFTPIETVLEALKVKLVTKEIAASVVPSSVGKGAPKKKTAAKKTRRRPLKKATG
ncbi:MAG TPA: hypothetical protein VHK91_10135 [Flavisolibacter sp.]|jgi:hypothetical protein|nr:hypothetical protein [Flavisolibacter sp.]